jgi:hypothetical protein
VIKLNAGFNKDREATVLVFVFSEMNLKLLMDENKPIAVKGADLGVGGCNFGFLAGHGQEQVVERVTPLLEKVYGKDGKVQALHIEEKFFLFPLPQGDNVLYVVAFDDPAYEILRKRGILTVRCRPVGEGTPVELVMCWSPTEELMEEELHYHKLIGPKTTIRRDMVTDGQNRRRE